MLTSSLLATLMLFALPDTMRESGALQLTVTNIKAETGRVWVGIYMNEEEFLDREKARLVEMKVDQKGQLIIPIDSLDYGSEYALAIFHDEDDDGEMNLNWFGLPSEPWAFSGEPKTRLRLPKFDEVKFCFKPGKEDHLVRLRKW